MFNPIICKRANKWTPGRADDAWLEGHEVGLVLNVPWVLFVENVHTLRVNYKQAERMALCRPDDSLVDVMIAKTVPDHHQPSATR